MTAARTATRGALPAGEPVQSFDEYVAQEAVRVSITHGRLARDRRPVAA